MSRRGRKKVGPGARSVWNATLDREAGSGPTQAGEVPAGLEEGRGGGDKGRDVETGSGGYGGDAVEAGYEEALGQPERPLDAEIHGDPRTPDGSGYPDDAKRSHAQQKPIGEAGFDPETD
jgi:hypothetical protein